MIYLIVNRKIFRCYCVVRRGDVLAAWSGIRPLVRDPNSKDTQSIARNHIIEVSNSNLVTIAGGKWTTYRSMAQETVDTVVSVGNLDHASSCRTDGLLLVGGDSYYPTLFITLIQDYGLDEEVCIILYTGTHTFYAVITTLIILHMFFYLWHKIFTNLRHS